MGESGRKRGGSDSCYRMEEKKQKGEKWSDYLKIAGLFEQPTEEEDNYTPFEFVGNTLKNIGKNTRHHTKGEKDIFTHITIPHFNLPEVVALSQKTHPPESKQPGFEAENEPTLRLIEDQNVFIRDNSGLDNKTGNILAVKVGSMMKLNPKPEDTAISSKLLDAVTTGLYRYLATNPKTADDNKRHKSRTADDESSGSEILREGGPPIPIPENQSRCINIHAYHTARYDNSVRNIKLYRGPAEIWEAKRGGAHTLKDYLRAINPLTQLTQKYFQYLLPDFYSKYKKVYDELPVTYLTDEEKEWFGIWTSRGTVLSAFTDVHVDLQDVPLGFCAIIPLGNFTDGHVCLPSLGIKLTLQPGSILFLRSHLLPHYVGKWTGNRFSIIQYTHQSVFDYYTEKTKDILFSLSEMPQWYQKRYKDDDN